MGFIGEHVQIWRAAIASLGRELTAWRPSCDRATFGAEAVLSVALAVAAAHALNLSNTWWAAISGFAVMQTSFTGSMQVVLCLLALSFGVWVGCHVQTGQEGASYVGRQFTIAFIMVFVRDHQWSADPVPALMRLSGILAGIVVITAVVLATSRRHGPPAFRLSAR